MKLEKLVSWSCWRNDELPTQLDVIAIDDQHYSIFYNGVTYPLDKHSTLNKAIDAFNHSSLNELLKVDASEAEPREFIIDVDGLESGDPYWNYKGVTNYIALAPKEQKLITIIPIEKYFETLPEFGSF